MIAPVICFIFSMTFCSNCFLEFQKKGLDIIGNCETISCKLALSDYTVLFANIMDIAQLLAQKHYEKK